MKLSTGLSWFLLFLSSTTNHSNAFTPHFCPNILQTYSPSNNNKSSVLILSSTNTDDAFSAFAQSIDEDNLFNDDNTKKSGSSSSSSNSVVTTWQESLEMLLDPTTPLAKRQILVSDLVNANEKIQGDIQSALRDRKIDTLLTPTGRKLQDGTRAVARQMTTDILPNIVAAATSSSRSPNTSNFQNDIPTILPKIGSRIFDAVSNQARKQLETLQEDLKDPARRIPDRISKQTSELVTEAKNVFLETPEGLKEPPYTLVSKCEGYEIRDYEGYTVASTSMAKVGESFSMDDVAKGGAAFNALAAYLFGANDEGRVMEMTTPVTTTSVGEMRFYLSRDDISMTNPSSSSLFPNPLSKEDEYNEQGVVKVVEVPPARLAVATFRGFATEGEISRQKDTLLTALAVDGVEVDVPHGAIVPHVIFQYNPPYTIPIIRRNEIAVPVVRLEDLNTIDEWGSDEEVDDGLTPSDVN